ncbi:hypothetical protein SAZ11_04010 [Streptomyces sp. FXJ1.4098]|nr:hypothetical protein [Streptomyces sp. FXJ1.4098]
MMRAGSEHLADPGILGRAVELSRLEDLLGAVDGTGPQVLVLTGEPGRARAPSSTGRPSRAGPAACGSCACAAARAKPD